MNKITKLAATFVCAASSLFANISFAATDLFISVNRSEMITLPQSVSEIIVSDDSVADVKVHNSTRVSIVGRSIGSTPIKFLDEDGGEIAAYEITVGHDLPAIRRAVTSFFPNELVGIEMVKDKVALTGIISSAENADRIVKVVAQYTGGDAESIINLADLRSGQQVMLRVRVGEMQRNVLRNLGLNFGSIGSSGDFLFGIASGTGIPVLAGDSTRVAVDQAARGAGAIVFDDGSSLHTSAIEALEQNGLIKIMAEPNIVAYSGEEAEFLAGGEFAIPVTDKDGNTDVEFKQYGIAVKFVPLVLADNRIRLIVAPEVSEIDSNADTNVDGIPGLISRKVKTTVELASGETLMIAGLMRENVASTIDDVPGVAEIPVLSALFRSTSYRRNETELVIAVTPYLVEPVANDDLKFPTDNFRPASVLEGFFYGALGSLSGDAQRISQTPPVEGPIGFMID
jgi:pilus assembly protein CpaC